MEQISRSLMNWASILEPNTREQAVATSRMPFIHPHLALMPDAHLGKGATVGSVIPTLGAVMPAAVGVDIGCGMIAVRTQYTVDGLPTDRAAVRTAIERAIPLSAGHGNAQLTESAAARCARLDGMPGVEHADQLAPKWRLQLGSLGSGNHFIEVTVDETGRVWLFLHSGSRGVGNKLAMHHIAVARRLATTWWIQLPDPDLAYLVEGTPEFTCTSATCGGRSFALLNREEMMDRVIACFGEWVGGPVEEAERINCHHNFTQRETHFGKDVWVSRKGAIEAREGMAGADSRLDGDGVVCRGRQGQSARARVRAARCGSRVLEVGGPPGVQPGRPADGDGRHRIPRHRCVHRRDPAGLQGHRPGDGRRADLVEVRHTLHQIVNVKGD